MNKKQIITIVTISLISIIIVGMSPTTSNFNTQAFADESAASKNLSHNDTATWSDISSIPPSATNSFYYKTAGSYMQQQSQQRGEYQYGLSSPTLLPSSNSSSVTNDFGKMTEHKQYFANNSTANNTSVNSNVKTTLPLSPTKAMTIGAWTPNQIPLQNMRGAEQQSAIATLLRQGFNEYYFVMNDFRKDDSRKTTESLLKSADGTALKIIILLLPPSESGRKGNFDWSGWIKYFNALKERHSSFYGFAIDDFNWINTKSKHTKFRNNIDFMIHSDLSKALDKKRKDVHFYPVIYFEGFKTNTAKRYYTNFADGLILASTDYYNVTTLHHDLKIFAKVFNNIPIRYVVYTTTTSTYFEQGYGEPSDRLVMATLSIATRATDGIIIWRDIGRNVVQDYAVNSSNPRYLSYLSSMEKSQIKEENDTIPHPALPSTIGVNTKNNNGNNNNKHPHVLLGLSGISLDPDLAQSMGLPKNYKGVLVKSVIKGEPAFKAGIKGEVRDIDTKGDLIVHGDVIIAIDGHKVKQTPDIVKRIIDKSPGDILNIRVNRDGQIMDFTATLDGVVPSY